MKILLIGHEGYLGKGLHEFLGRQHSVIGWDKKENLFNLDAKFLVQQSIELVINLAVAADRHSKKFQISTLTDEVNVGGARHLARILKGSEIPWVQMSTREVLGPVYSSEDILKTEGGFRPKFLIHEDYPYAPTNFYGKSKIMAEFIAESHPESIIIRLATCYTDYDHLAGNWVVSLVRSAITKGVASLTRGGEQFRDPLHVDDLGKLILLLCEKKVFNECIHAGGGDHNLISLSEFVRLANPLVKIEEIPGGDCGFAFDITKAKRLTAWNPSILVRDKVKVIAENIRQLNTQSKEFLPIDSIAAL